jgi:hypothetical protein
MLWLVVTPASKPLWRLWGTGDFGGQGALGPLHLKNGRVPCPLALRPKIKRLIPIPNRCVYRLKRTSETGISYQVVPVELKDDSFSISSLQASAASSRSADIVKFLLHRPRTLH